MPTVGNRSFTAPPGRWPVAAVFDCDGLLLDSSARWEQAFRSTAATVGTRLTPGHLASLRGASVATAAQALAAISGVPVGEAALRAQLDLAFAAAPTPPALVGVTTLLRAIHGRLPIAVATNGPHDLVRRALRDADLLGFFTDVVSAEHVPRAKPAPDVYLLACRRLGVDPSDAVAFEDSAAGLAAAQAAGLLTIGVPSLPRSPLRADLVTSRLDDPRIATFLGLPSRSTAGSTHGGWA